MFLNPLPNKLMKKNNLRRLSTQDNVRQPVSEG